MSISNNISWKDYLNLEMNNDNKELPRVFSQCKLKKGEGELLKKIGVKIALAGPTDPVTAVKKIFRDFHHPLLFSALITESDDRKTVSQVVALVKTIRSSHILGVMKKNTADLGTLDAMVKKYDVNKIIHEERRQTLLHIAAAKGWGPLVHVLVTNNTDVNIKDNHGHTPIFHALENGHLVIARVLSYRGARMDVTSNDDFDPIGYLIGLKKTETLNSIFADYPTITKVLSLVKTKKALEDIIIFNIKDICSTGTNPLLIPFHMNSITIAQEMFCEMGKQKFDEYKKILNEQFAYASMDLFDKVNTESPTFHS
ncbi:MAG: ankyrin repeat domain-containing protein [Chlamydiales bacterium]|nr:ankyrin repeat domain-containing protein [Chlamydiia bacterium]MCP5508755.1 ankyrin repeat domain-containing protein [Chlamydiales bacterium]